MIKFCFKLITDHCLRKNFKLFPRNQENDDVNLSFYPLVSAVWRSYLANPEIIIPDHGTDEWFYSLSGINYCIKSRMKKSRGKIYGGIGEISSMFIKKFARLNYIEENDLKLFCWRKGDNCIRRPMCRRIRVNFKQKRKMQRWRRMKRE